MKSPAPPSPIRVTAAATALAVATSTLVAAVVLASPAAASVTIDPPGSPRAGTVHLTGQVGVDPGEVTSVLYVLDATRSTSSLPGADCSGNGASGPEDDLNGDGSVGDILDCEIAGVGALNRSLAASSGLQVGLVAFSNQAAAANLGPTGTTSFLPPAFTGGDARPRIDMVASSIVRNRIGLYETKELGGSGAGTAFNNAISVALSTLDSAPDGPKWIMFLSDGQSAIDDGLLDRLGRADVRLRSFGIGGNATCAPYASLYKLASATGETCQLVPDPALLTAGLTGSRPDAVNGVNVTIGRVSVAATVDAVGGWRAGFTLGAGTYTATATAVLASGATQRTQRTFTVAPASGGPAPDTVALAPEALAATVIKVKRPKPTRKALPSRVTGRVGQPIPGLTVTRSLTGAKVRLQARPKAGAPWSTVGSDRVDRKGRFVLKWKPRARLRQLRVVLEPAKRFAGSAAAVPRAQISACKVNKRGARWSVKCQTTAKAGSAVRLLDRQGKVVDKARVRKGTLRLKGKGRVGTHSIRITLGKRHIRLAL